LVKIASYGGQRGWITPARRCGLRVVNVAASKSLQRISGVLGSLGSFVVLDEECVDVNHGMNPIMLNSALAVQGKL